MADDGRTAEMMYSLAAGTGSSPRDQEADAVWPRSGAWASDTWTCEQFVRWVFRAFSDPQGRYDPQACSPRAWALILAAQGATLDRQTKALRSWRP